MTVARERRLARRAERRLQESVRSRGHRPELAAGTSGIRGVTELARLAESIQGLSQEMRESIMGVAIGLINPRGIAENRVESTDTGNGNGERTRGVRI